MPSVRSMIASDAAKYSQLPDRWTKRNSSTGSSAVVRLSTRVYRYRPARCDVRASAASRAPRVPAVTSRASARTRADSGGSWRNRARVAASSGAPRPDAADSSSDRDVAKARGGIRHRDAARVVHHDRVGAQRETEQARRREEHVGAEGLEVDLLDEDGSPRPEAPDLELARRRAPDLRPLAARGGPRVPVVRVEGHAPPPEVREPLGLDHRLLGDLDSHGDRAVGLDLAERSELHAIREADDHPGRGEREREGGPAHA